jgi:alpha-1,6-mannosyltransferase
MEIIYLLLIWFYVLLFPYTKVEESFNLQAIHDIMELKSNIVLYDHLEFPGVVPRTFIGALVTGICSMPFYYIKVFLKLPKFLLQYCSRMVLGTLTWLAFARFKKSVQMKFGRRCSNLLVMFHILQFHLPYYSSRTLPNTFALILTYLAFSEWFQVKFYNFFLVVFFIEFFHSRIEL